jgi:hypothetical protein
MKTYQRLVVISLFFVLGCGSRAKMAEGTASPPMVSLVELAYYYGSLTGRTVVVSPDIPDKKVALPPQGITTNEACQYIRNTLKEYDVSLEDFDKKFVKCLLKRRPIWQRPNATNREVHCAE